jgi:hypothetical protein
MGASEEFPVIAPETLPEGVSRSGESWDDPAETDTEAPFIPAEKLSEAVRFVVRSKWCAQRTRLSRTKPQDIASFC